MEYSYTQQANNLIAAGDVLLIDKYVLFLLLLKILAIFMHYIV